MQRRRGEETLSRRAGYPVIISTGKGTASAAEPVLSVQQCAGETVSRDEPCGKV
ncbi:hypothetical protein ACNKHQ_09875 [Shigella flexneri]